MANSHPFFYLKTANFVSFNPTEEKKSLPTGPMKIRLPAFSADGHLIR